MKRSAIEHDLFAADKRRVKLDRLGDLLRALDAHIDFAALAAEVDCVAPRPVSAQGGRPPFPTETMVRIAVVKRLHNLSDEQVEFQLLDRLSFQRFCGLQGSASIPDRTTVWTFENRIGADAAKALFEGVLAQLADAGDPTVESDFYFSISTAIAHIRIRDLILVLHPGEDPIPQSNPNSRIFPTWLPKKFRAQLKRPERGLFEVPYC